MNVCILQDDKADADKHYKAATDSLTKYQKAFKAYSENSFYGDVLLFFSRYHIYRGEYGQALASIGQLKHLALSTQDSSRYLVSFAEEARTKFLQKDYNASLAAAREALTHKFYYIDFFDYEMEAYRYAYLSAQKLGMNKEAEEYSAKYFEKYNALSNQKKKEALSHVLSQIEQVPLQYEIEKKNSNIYLLISILLSCILVLAILLAYLKHTKKQYKNRQKQFDLTIRELNERLSARLHASSEQLHPDMPETLSSSRKVAENEEFVTQKEEQETLPAILTERQKQVLVALDAFESDSTAPYTDKNLNLAALAGLFQTNPGTLSMLINKYKGQNFNDYLNNLRINYIIEQLNSDKQFRTYKISYLAEQSGFSSHSIFTKAFRKKVNMTPSQFIDLLNKKN